MAASPSRKLTGSLVNPKKLKMFSDWNFTCAYCGFDGRTFGNWLQLSVDHIRPRKNGGKVDDPENQAVCCHACNSMTSRMKFAKRMSCKEIIREKRNEVAKRRKGFFEYWIKNVAPAYSKSRSIGLPRSPKNR